MQQQQIYKTQHTINTGIYHTPFTRESGTDHIDAYCTPTTEQSTMKQQDTDYKIIIK
jgi:hypothetical protein